MCMYKKNSIYKFIIMHEEVKDEVSVLHRVETMFIAEAEVLIVLSGVLSKNVIS